jgi:hypothetical protein
MPLDCDISSAPFISLCWPQFLRTYQYNLLISSFHLPQNLPEPNEVTLNTEAVHLARISASTCNLAVYNNPGDHHLNKSCPEGLETCIFNIRFRCVVYCRYHSSLVGYVMVQLVEALRNKPEGCVFNSRWCHCNFSWT